MQIPINLIDSVIMASASLDYSKLKMYREALGFTQEELAELLGVAVGTIQQWEGGTRRMRTWFAELFILKVAAKKGVIPPLHRDADLNKFMENMLL